MKKSTAFVATAMVIIAALAISFIADSKSANAIPAFARKYNMSCTTCHNPVPRLKAYGDEFAGNGFVLKDQDAPRYFVDTGDENLSLIRDFPIAVRMDGYIKYESVGGQRPDMTTPYLLKLLSGGSLAEDLAYYFYFYMDERGEVVGVEDAYLMFNDLFGSELDVYVGQFQISDPLFKRELRLTLEDYEIYKTSVGESSINLAYDRGLMLTYGFETGTDVILEVVNGNGLPEADKFKVYDSDKYKSFVGRVSQDVNDYARIGGFGYYGKEGVSNPNEVWMIGPDFTVTDGYYAELNVQYLERRDSDPLFEGDRDDDVETRGAMAEVIFTPNGDRSKWYGVCLFNWVESDFSEHDYRTIGLHAGYLLRTNVRLVGELDYDMDTEERRISAGFVAGF